MISFHEFLVFSIMRSTNVEDETSSMITPMLLS
jgi:hypothetical protein